MKLTEKKAIVSQLVPEPARRAAPTPNGPCFLKVKPQPTRAKFWRNTAAALLPPMTMSRLRTAPILLLAALSCGGLIGPVMGKGLPAEAKMVIREEIRKVIAEGWYPGISILLIQDGEVHMREAHGVLNLETKEPLTEMQLCWLASTGKIFTATLMAMLVDDGRVSFDDPIAKFFPEFAQIRLRDGAAPKQPVLLRHALSHTSGLPSDRWLEDKGIAKGDPAYAGFFHPKTPRDFIDGCLKVGLVAEPGTTMMYGRPIDLAACVAEQATGRTFAELMERRVFTPLGLKQTTIRPTPTQIARIAPLYQAKAAGAYLPDPFSLEVAHSQNAGMSSAGGGVYATLDDVGRLMLLHLNRGRHEGRQLINAATLQRLYERQPGARDYGLAFQIRDSDVNGRSRVLYHPGYSGPAAWVDFERGLAGVMMMQSNTEGRNKHHQRIIDTIYRFIPAKK